MFAKCFICEGNKFLPPNFPATCLKIGCGTIIHRDCFTDNKCPSCDAVFEDKIVAEDFFHELYSLEDQTYFVIKNADVAFKRGQFDEWEKIQEEIELEKLTDIAAALTFFNVSFWPPEGLLGGLEEIRSRVLNYYEKREDTNLVNFLKERLEKKNS